MILLITGEHLLSLHRRNPPRIRVGPQESRCQVLTTDRKRYTDINFNPAPGNLWRVVSPTPFDLDRFCVGFRGKRIPPQVPSKPDRFAYNSDQVVGVRSIHCYGDPLKNYKLSFYNGETRLELLPKVRTKILLEVIGQ